MDLVFLKHQATTEVVPNQSHIMEYFEDAKKCVHDLTGIINKLNAEIRLLKLTANWTARLPQEGANRAYISTSDMDTIKEFIKQIESEDQNDSMPRHYYATNNRCLHCKGTYTSEDHHLSLGIAIVSNSGYIDILLPQEQTHPNQADTRTIDNYKTMRFSLLLQHHTYYQSQQWMHPLPQRLPPPCPTLPTQSQHLMPATTSSTSTKKSWISYTTNRTSNFAPPHPYHPIRALPRNRNKTQSSNSFEKNAPASPTSNGYSTWPMTTTRSLSASMKTHPSPTMRIGDRTAGDRYLTGSNSRCSQKHHHIHA
jgi:hypothetical protein